ncbi:unnamed protein product [Ectocarpus sp. 6 AP-2014]
MTRWDCDVRLWRGVPCSFPKFYGWPVSSFRNDDLVLSSTCSLRYVWCGVCYKWFPELSRYHACATTQAPHHQQSDVTEESDTEEQSAYVVATEDNEHLSRCNLCTDRMRMNFRQDIEEWVYMDCVEHEGVLVHKLCRDVFVS